MTADKLPNGDYARLIGVIERVGFPVALNLFLLYVGYQSWSRQEQRLDSLNQYITTTLSSSLDENTEALVDNTAALNTLEDIQLSRAVTDHEIKELLGNLNKLIETK